MAKDYFQLAIERYKSTRPPYVVEKLQTGEIDKAFLSPEQIRQIFNYEIPQTRTTRKVQLYIALEKHNERIIIEDTTNDSSACIELLDDKTILVTKDSDDFDNRGSHTRIVPNDFNIFTVCDKTVSENGAYEINVRPFQISDSYQITNPKLPFPITQETLFRALLDAFYEGRDNINIATPL
ncbi:hypothetical protein M0R04_03435 [Candidatus Dojkabacteria bacterium]|jgi:hypothetical protein|nr:hypothetical protein [Candidatus Dojkabacteria bacterium]